MRHLKIFSLTPLVFTFLLLSVISCSKDNAPAPPTGIGGAAIVNGNYGFDGNRLTQFACTKAGIVQTNVAGISSFNISAIRDGGNESITIIAFKNITGPTTVDFSAALSNGGIMISKDYSKPGDQALNYSTDNNGSGGTKGGGQMKVTAFDGTNIEGTFYAVAYNGTGSIAAVEQGTFKGKVTK
ncbi:MAG: hypothetical protein ABIO05_05590 [Ferruginibacter sp.]